MTEERPAPARLLLLSGGIDSTCLAAWIRPEQALFINYGQGPALAEQKAAAAIARDLEIPFGELDLDISRIGSGLLAGTSPEKSAPSPEWWPFRNQLLVTFAAAWVLRHAPAALAGHERIQILTGTVKSDGSRHLDGAKSFYLALDALLLTQEGGFEVQAPAIDLETVDLVRESGIDDSVLAWTHSCHRATLPCGECPGCYKREQVLEALGRLA